MKQNILITGGNGQLAQCLRLFTESESHNFLFADVDVLDINDQTQFADFIRENSIHFIINCAAFTAVDLAESQAEKAFEINHRALEKMVDLCQKNEIYLVHISTDYVFDGKSTIPYHENDTPNPTCVYGRSKFEGELEVLKYKDKAIVIRTSWLYSQFGNNFVKTISNKAKTLGQLKVVNDQFGNPTYAVDLARFILFCVNHAQEVFSFQNPIFHFSNTGNISWYDFASKICDISNIQCVIEPVDSSQFPTPAKRPQFSVFDTRKVSEQLHYPIQKWEESLQTCIKALNEIN